MVTQLISDRAGTGNPGRLLPCGNYWLSSSCLLETWHAPCISPWYVPGPLHSLMLLACPLQAFEFEISDMPRHPFPSLAILGSFKWVSNKNACLIGTCPGTSFICPGSHAGLDLSAQNPSAKFSRVNCFPNVGQRV